MWDFAFCIFQQVTCREVVIFHIFKLKKGSLPKELLKYHEAVNFCVIGNSINKNRIVIILEGYHNVIHFSIIGNLYISM